MYIYVYNSLLFSDIALGVPRTCKLFAKTLACVMQFRSNSVFTLSLPCYGLDDQQKKLLVNERKKTRLKAQRAAEMAEEKLVSREK